jgi:hypothetical protein
MALLDDKRFMSPLTPSGRASLLDLATEPTQRIAGDMMVIGFEADPEVVRKYVPEPLELDGSGLIYLRTYNAWFYSDRMQTEFVSPERSNYTETFFWIPCDYKGERYHYMLYSWVNRDWLAFLGRHAGMPHKVANVQMTPFHPADPVYNGPKPGIRICTSVDCVGTVVRTYLDFKEPVPDDQPLPFRQREGYTPKYLGRRQFYDVVSGRPIVDDLVAHWGDAMEYSTVWSGDANVTFYEHENEEVLPFQPRRMVGGWWFTLRFDHQTSPPKIVHSYI